MVSAGNCKSLSSESQISGVHQLTDANPDSFSYATEAGVELGGRTSQILL